MVIETDREKCSHLLRRFGIGASEAELDYYLSDGFPGAIERMLDDKSDDGYSLNPEQLVNGKGILPMPVAIDWWITRMLVTRRPVREKMALFWHFHVVCLLRRECSRLWLPAHLPLVCCCALAHAWP